ncbi:cysteine three histidine 1 [Alosa sapidissima]|uniref:cysteine three histidine 1 n=1 Tax=Alosa sapidissima TaxID=34773 RepID=UPI001C08EE0F|nr:cysteine three histidine 1 [Alosa sapidissima]
MFETSHNDLMLFASQEDEAAVHNLLCDGEAPTSQGLSLAEALLPLVQTSAPQLTPLLYSTRYKTELCSRYAETGACKYAERCQFAHGLHDLHVPSRHPKYKTELCRTFHTAGYCVYGTRCLFVHSLQEQRPPSRHQRRPGHVRTVPCRNYRAFGVCPFGTHCHFLHVDAGASEASTDSEEEKICPPPTASSATAVPHVPARSEWKPRGTLCRTFSAFGFCLYGTRCRFQHGLPKALQGSSLDSFSAPSPSSSQPTWPSFPTSLTQLPTRAVSPASDMRSSSPTSWSSSSPPSALASPIYPDDGFPITPPLSCEPLVHNAFTFSSQHLNDLLLPLAFRLQQLETSQAMEALDKPLGL